MSNAAKHYLYYPKDEVGVKPVWAYGFRPFFLILPWYVVILIILWGLNYSGIINLLPFLNPVAWHIYEFIYGVGSAAIVAFLLTGLPEFFPGVVPIVGKKLKFIVLLWILGRISFWFMDIFGNFSMVIAMVLNISLLFFILSVAFKPVVLDPLQRHSSIAYISIMILFVQIMFFLSFFDGLNFATPESWLYVSISLFIILVLIALRRIQTEEINEFMEALKMEEKFIARPYRYNLAIFCILSFCISEFFALGSISGWLAFASFASVLGIINDYKLNYESVFIHSYVFFFLLIILMIACGYLLLGLNYFGIFSNISFARHVLSMGGIIGAVLVAMLIISFVHTGRKPKGDIFIYLSILFLVISIICRYFVYLGSYMYFVASLFLACSFMIYFFRFKNYLLNRRADGLLG